MRTVILLAPHTHNGIDYKEGDTIELSEADAEWLINSYIEQRIQTRELAKQTPSTLEWYENTVDQKMEYIRNKAKGK